MERHVEDGGVGVRLAAGQATAEDGQLDLLPRNDGGREDVLDLRTVADDQPVRQAAGVGDVVQAHHVIAVGRRDEVEERVGAVVVRLAAGQLAAVGGGQHERRPQRRVEAEGLAIDGDALALFGGEAEEVVAVVVALAVDGGVHRHGLGLLGAVVGFLFEHLRQAAADREEAAARYAVLADDADLVRARRRVPVDGDAELVRLDRLGLEAGVVEVKGLRFVKVLAGDVEQHFRAGRAAEREGAVEPRLRQLGRTMATKNTKRHKNQNGRRDGSPCVPHGFLFVPFCVFCGRSPQINSSMGLPSLRIGIGRLAASMNSWR